MVAIFGTWIAFWLAYGLIGYNKERYFSELFLEESSRDHLANMHRVAQWSKLATEGSNMAGKAVVYGGGGTLLGLYVLGLSVWIYRGYRPKRPLIEKALDSD